MRSQPHAPAALRPRKGCPVPIQLEVACTPEPVCMLWRSDKSLASPENGTPDRPAHSLVTMQIVLSWQLQRGIFNGTCMSSFINAFLKITINF
jgi:hypothetical protein